jgi:hypothetical protein
VWYNRTQLSINPQKMMIVSFPRKGDLRGQKEQTLYGQTLQMSTTLRHLRLILDKGLTCKAQLKNIMNKAYNALWTHKNKFGTS